ncbi:MAG: YbjN domain-containing protein, partial [Altererythrobacter sp.]|nr:YbjN domain-containing protein [Altererythrobacter sp.]
FYALFDSGGTAEYANKVNKNWAAIKATALDDNKLLLSRYVILDHGQTLANLRLNLVTTRGIASTVSSELAGQVGSDQTSERAAINWGDDSGDYANDGACDDARFLSEGDQWDYQRKHVLRDATDCRAQAAAGAITLLFDFGGNSGSYANDGTCDDSRFTGEGRSILITDSHVRRDSADCIAAYREGTINRP